MANDLNKGQRPMAN